MQARARRNWRLSKRNAGLPRRASPLDQPRTLLAPSNSGESQRIATISGLRVRRQATSAGSVKRESWNTCNISYALRRFHSCQPKTTEQVHSKNDVYSRINGRARENTSGYSYYWDPLYGLIHRTITLKMHSNDGRLNSLCTQIATLEKRLLLRTSNQREKCLRRDIHASSTYQIVLTLLQPETCIHLPLFQGRFSQNAI